MTPSEMVPTEYLDRQWRYLSGGGLLRRIVASWRCARVANAYVARARLGRALRRAHRKYERVAR